MTEKIYSTLRPIVAPFWLHVAPLRTGDWVIYRKSKRSKNPGRRAFAVKATMKGETYAYVVDKFWIVQQVLPDNRVVVRTNSGKEHVLSANDPNLIRAGLLARLRWGQRFRSIEQNAPQSIVAA